MADGPQPPDAVPPADEGIGLPTPPSPGRLPPPHLPPPDSTPSDSTPPDPSPEPVEDRPADAAPPPDPAGR